MVVELSEIHKQFKLLNKVFSLHQKNGWSIKCLETNCRGTPKETDEDNGDTFSQTHTTPNLNGSCAMEMLDAN